MTTFVLHCLHGTFQGPGVWTSLETTLSEHVRVPLRIIAETLEPPRSGGGEAWARSFCARVARRRETGGVEQMRILLGYSLGGRLAMQTLLACPGAWSAAVLVAAHPGDSDPDVRAEARERDARWAARCRGVEPWERLLEEWDALPVFAGHPNRASRDPAVLSRERCARSFEAFSRGRQADLRSALAAAKLPPVLYVTGADDSRYRAIGTELSTRVAPLRHETIPGAGHRVPWDQPAEFADRVGTFLNSLAARPGADG
jgi:2-succinyl-6-hydroxy-2,4-cyclohexadiene-1-carboxylate synthase